MDAKQFIKIRKQHLEDLKRFANHYLQENKKIKDTHEHRWEAEVIENNIVQLKRIITNANRGLESKELEKYTSYKFHSYAELRRTLGIQFEEGETIESYMTRMTDGAERFEILTYSPGYSIEYDLYWIPDGTVGDLQDVAEGVQSPELYEKFCPTRIAIIQNEVIPYFLKNERYRKHVQLLKDIIKAFGNSSFLFINIVLITAAESILRELCGFVFAKQNRNKTEQEVSEYIYKKFNSLETLILKGEWKEDIPVDIREALVQSRFIKEESLNKSQAVFEQHKQALKLIEAEMAKVSGLINRVNSGSLANDDALKDAIDMHLEETANHAKGLMSEDAKIEVTIRARLQFLLRRYKEDRNSIIHGNYSDFDKGWKTYVYLSAITKIFDLIKEYDKIYA